MLPFTQSYRAIIGPHHLHNPADTPQRRLLRYREFDSVDALSARVIAFINDYNRKARPFQWTYDGRPLKIA